MNCKRYQDAIQEAALGTLSATRTTELNAHLDACSDCRRALDTAQTLLAAIDRGVAASVSGKPSPEFAARVRMRLADAGADSRQTAPWALWRWLMPSAWVPVSVAVLAALLLAAWFVRRPTHPPEPDTARITSRPAAPTNGSSEQARLTPRTLAAIRPFRPADASRPHFKPQASPDTEAPQLQVQVQPGQWAAVTSLYRAAQAGHLKGAAEASPTADEPLQVKPVEVAPLVIAELQDLKPVGTENANGEDR